MADAEVFEWAKSYAEQHSITALAALTGEYGRTAISLYLSGKYSAEVGKIEAVLRLYMDSRRCPYLDRDIRADDCTNRSTRPRPQRSGSEMETHWLACQGCAHKTQHPQGGNKP